MGDWEDDNYEPPSLNSVPKNWDDEDAEPVLPTAPAQQPTKAEEKAKAAEKPAQKAPAKAAPSKAPVAGPSTAPAETESQRRERMQKEVESADFENAQQLFAEFTVSAKTKDDILSLSRTVGNKLVHLSKRPHEYVTLLDNLMKILSEPMKSEDLRKVISTMNAIANTKQKEEKAKSEPKKKATSSAKPTLNLGSLGTEVNLKHAAVEGDPELEEFSEDDDYGERDPDYDFM